MIFEVDSRNFILEIFNYVVMSITISDHGIAEIVRRWLRLFQLEVTRNVMPSYV